MSKGISTRAENYAQWYNDIVIKADMAEHSDVRGCMVIKPYGFAIWEAMKEDLDHRFKETGHVNAYFPLFIPKSYLSKEADHVEGFAKECAVVTHYRLKNDPNGGVVVDPEAKLEEELIVRPTSETIIWNSYRNWIQSYRDLPILINQWANVVRWEMRTRLFLRTAEFLWQEGHTAHSTREEAIQETETMLGVYADFVKEVLAIPVIQGVKTKNERFAGAEETYCIEALMQDGRALQAGTSHFLGQNFAKAFDVRFLNKEGESDYVWATSWGVSTRLMGALIMSHSDDKGLVLPPKVAPYQVVIVPFMTKDKDVQKALVETADSIANDLKALGIRVKVDVDETKRPGFKFAQYELQGYPIRVVIGPRDLENKQVEVMRRDLGEKESYSLEGLSENLEAMLHAMQDALYSRRKAELEESIKTASTYEEFKSKIAEGGFVEAWWNGQDSTEEMIRKDTKATARCIRLEDKQADPSGKQCLFTGEAAVEKVLFAKAY